MNSTNILHSSLIRSSLVFKILEFRKCTNKMSRLGSHDRLDFKVDWLSTKRPTYPHIFGEHEKGVQALVLAGTSSRHLVRDHTYNMPHPPECIDFLIQQLKQSCGEKLPVLDHWLLWWTWCLGSSWLRHTQSIPKVGVHSIVGLPLSLGGLNPRNETPLLKQ